MTVIPCPPPIQALPIASFKLARLWEERKKNYEKSVEVKEIKKMHDTAAHGCILTLCTGQA